MSILIVIVEDDPVQQKLYSLLCKKFGFEYRIFHCSADALAFVNSTPELPSVVLLDCILKGEYGLDAVCHLKELAELRGRQLPIVAVTANAFEADRRHCLDSGADDFLPKPFTMDQFKQLINHWSSTSQVGVA